MQICPKCNAVNDEGITRCLACNAILPVKIGSRSEARWERVRRRPELVGSKCPACGTVNPYTRLRCESCGASMSGREARAGISWLWVFLTIAVGILGVLTLLALRSP
jgi:hypothetical protein